MKAFRFRRGKKNINTKFLNLGATDIQGWKILHYEGLVLCIGEG